MKTSASSYRIFRIVASLVAVLAVIAGAAITQPAASVRQGDSLRAYKSIPVADGSESNGGKGGKGGAKRAFLA
jgi:hypothetical protein